MTEIIKTVASEILRINSEWLSEIRSVGYLVRGTDETIIQGEELEEIGLSDRNGQSGYIRMRQNESFFTSVLPPVTSDSTGLRYFLPLRIVLLVKTHLALDVSVMISRQLNALNISDNNGVRNIKASNLRGFSNSQIIYKEESGGNQLNNEYRVAAVDFSLSFDDYTNCDVPIIPELTMNCRCTNVFDLGCHKSCDTLEIDVEATHDNVVVSTKFNGTLVEFNAAQTVGENILIPLSNLNEDYLHTLELYMNGEQVTYQPEPSGTIYDCFKIKTLP